MNKQKLQFNYYWHFTTNEYWRLLNMLVIS